MSDIVEMVRPICYITCKMFKTFYWKTCGKLNVANRPRAQLSRDIFVLCHMIMYEQAKHTELIQLQGCADLILGNFNTALL